ncbi:MBL fold metallo-hydrolase [Bdellovibrionota bacterium FG-2]
MRVRFWGVRGSIATPGKNTAEFGGNTTCIEVEDDFGQTFIFDAGTGIRELGLDLARRKVGVIHLFITHTHWDHIQGFPFFVSAYIPGNEIHIYGPTHFEHTLKKIMDLQMDYAYFPISMQQLNAAIEYSDLKEQTLEIGGTTIQTQYSNHPVTGLCYKITCNGKSLVFTGDMETYYNVLSTGGEDPGEDEELNQIVAERNERHQAFCQADLLIHDAQYTAEEYPKFQGWGHSSMESVISIVKSPAVKKLILTHHDPTRTDQALSALENKFKAEHPELDFCFSKEAMEVQL